MKIPVTMVTKPELHKLYSKNHDKNHQGLLLDAEPLSFIPIQEPEEAISYRYGLFDLSHICKTAQISL
jgi:hypothetical protein